MQGGILVDVPPGAVTTGAQVKVCCVNGMGSPALLPLGLGNLNPCSIGMPRNLNLLPLQRVSSRAGSHLLPLPMGFLAHHFPAALTGAACGPTQTQPSLSNCAFV